MSRKLGISLAAALLIPVMLCLLLSQSVSAQGTEPDEPIAPGIDPIVATIEQAVPLTLTLNFPSVNGVLTFAIPVVLNLDITLNISNRTTATIMADVEPITVTQTITDEVTAPTATPLPPTPTPTATPAPPTPTPTAVPAEEEEATEEEAEGEAETAPTPVPVATTTETDTETTSITTTEGITSTGETTPTAVIEVTAPACEDPRSVITSPGANQVVSGNVEIRGTAVHEQFNYYKIEYTPGADPNGEYSFLSSATVQLTNDLLSVWNTSDFANGTYTLRLTVVDTTGNFPPPCTVTVFVQN